MKNQSKPLLWGSKYTKYAYKHVISKQQHYTYSQHFIDFIVSEIEKEPKKFVDSLKKSKLNDAPFSVGHSTQLGYGHKKTYWDTANRVEAETWAQYGRMMYEKQEDVHLLLNELFPETTKEITRIVTEMIK